MKSWDPAVEVTPLGNGGTEIDGRLISRLKRNGGQIYRFRREIPQGRDILMTLSDFGSIASIISLVLTITGIVRGVIRILLKKKK